MKRNFDLYLFLSMFFLVAVGASTAGASFLGDEIFLPAVGRGAGALNSNWYTTVWFHNPGSEAVDVSVSLLLRNQANPDAETQVFTVPASTSLNFSDAIMDLFGLDSAVGAFRIRSTGVVAVGARVFNQPGAGISESQGQFIAGMPAKFSVAPGHSIEIPGILQPGDGSFRCNFGLVETSGAPTEVLVRLMDQDGLEIASKSYSLGAYASLQKPLSDLEAALTVEDGILSFEVTGTEGAVLAYASAIANGLQSQDPTTLDMTLDPSLLGAITGIEAGPGLEGGGTEGMIPLSVRASDGIEVDSSGVSIRDGGIKTRHIASGQAVLGARVGAEVLKDVVSFEGGENTNVVADGNTIQFSAFGCFGQRREIPITRAVLADSAGQWFAGSDHLDLSAAGRWRVGYRVLVEIHNNGYSTLSEPVSVALVDASEGEVIQSSISVLGQQVDLNSSLFMTVSGEAVIDVDRPTTIVVASRSSRNDLSISIQPDDFDLSSSLPAPDGASFMFSECFHLDD